MQTHSHLVASVVFGIRQSLRLTGLLSRCDLVLLKKKMKRTSSLTSVLIVVVQKLHLGLQRLQRLVLRNAACTLAAGDLMRCIILAVEATSILLAHSQRQRLRHSKNST